MKHLFQKIEESGIIIDELCFLPGEFCKEGSEFIEELTRDLNAEQFIKMMGWRFDQDVIDYVQSHYSEDDQDLQQCLLDNRAYGFIARLILPSLSQISIRDGEYSSSFISRGCGRIEYVYSPYIDELVDKAIRKYEFYQEELIEKERKSGVLSAHYSDKVLDNWIQSAHCNSGECLEGLQ